MVSRSTRNYKGRKPIAVFGQFILPLAIIIAIALLYFSIKLFFLTPGAPRTNGTANVPAAPVTAPATSAAVSGDEPKEQAQVNTVKPKIVAGPVTQPSGQTAPSTTPAAPTKPVQPAQKPDPAQKPQQATQPAQKPAVTPGTQPPAAKPPAQAATQRFDVQIGAFASKENALQLVQKARGQGHEVYVNEAVHEGSPYFRVRVKGPAVRQDAQTLSAKLQEQGYPVYIVPIN